MPLARPFGSSSSLDGLSDVSITSAEAGHVLQFGGSDWINLSLGDAGIASTVTTGILSDQILSLNFGIGNLSDQISGKSDIGHAHAATDITSGTLNDLRLSSNVAMKNAANTFTLTNTFAAVNLSSLNVNASKMEVDSNGNTYYAAGAKAYGLTAVGLTVEGAETISGGTVTTSTPVLNLSQTWNSSGTSFTAMKLNVTNTASDSTSKLLDLQVGGTTLAYVRKDGLIRGWYGSFENVAADTAVFCSQFCSPVDTTIFVNINRTFTSFDDCVEMARSTWTNTSGASRAVTILPTYNQTSGTAANTDLLINRTQTAVGSGNQRLIDAQVGGVSKFTVGNSGQVTAASTVTAPNLIATTSLSASECYANYVYATSAMETGDFYAFGPITTEADLYVLGSMSCDGYLTAGSGVTTYGTSAAVRYVQNSVPSLTDATTIATNAAMGNLFRVTIAGNRTLGTPTNGVDGQEVTWEIKQDATGSRTITLSSGFQHGTDITSVVLTTTAGKFDILKARYNATAGKWFVIGFARGY